jgi:uncharacterized membrane protein
MSSSQGPIFEALIVPHRSLSRKGVCVLVGALTILSLAVAFRFWLLKAWPVVAFSLVDIPLVVLMLAINIRGARASELIMLDAHQLTVIHTDSAGRRKQVSLPAAWLRIVLDPGKGVPQVVLSSHGRDCEVGAFLHEPEKLSLFAALSDALDRARNPRFHNPQLED